MFDLLLTFVLNTIMTAGSYFLVPVIIAYSGKKFTTKQIKTIVIINGVIVWLILAVLRVEKGIEGSGVSVFLWSAYNHYILKENCLKK